MNNIKASLNDGDIELRSNFGGSNGDFILVLGEDSSKGEGGSFILSSGPTFRYKPGSIVLESASSSTASGSIF